MMWNLLLINSIVILFILASDLSALCPDGCPCYDDSRCQYYCKDGECQPQKYEGYSCSGMDIHPRECGSVSYCDKDRGYTCRFQRSENGDCDYDYMCWSHLYCDKKSKTCKYRYGTGFVLSIILPILGGILLISFIIFFVQQYYRRKRLRQSAFAGQPGLNQPYAVYNHNQTMMPMAPTYGETAPPPYTYPQQPPRQKS
ncbi:unnamed protein product [Didymodactylos carnosus]|uniref:Uncharacterized protein n=1 Tax=Didymodactylos carnosus TaxID=1234261 RepID=A0A814LN06_9BILA|nr:unnamed protein product [Didymodactylos carnosus]CAF1067408.1 unnamed protein product [Didymodactylos carnosus]CAF3557952.1 unnamed protein product [Didymodactylos carnosus]CAF3834946.1 unnamed protein product [Didymodactylos carnosus]